ncbi:MAG: acylneuraminate cytidylyltransferase [Fluviicola sp.]|nr:MAG: acylneuraminate cytidylyltransferase [Fluviicola sp.]
MSILVVIPARGGSKGIPRKNLRKLGNLPLIGYSINNALNSKHDLDVYVSSDDEEILSISEQLGAKLHPRSKKLAEDQTTLDPVIFEAYEFAKQAEGKQYDLIVTLQPTSPLLSSNAIDRALDKMIESRNIDTIISAVESTHLTWSKNEKGFYPNYTERVNRQQLTPVYKETGGFLITRSSIITEKNRIGDKVELFELQGKESIDIDTYEDWNLCEYYLKKKNILFVLTGNKTVGLGHVYNTLILANEILNHNVSFLVDKDSELAFQKIKSSNYSVRIQSNEDIIDDIETFNPDVVINDCLDTKQSYIMSLKEKNIHVINIEDLGEGAKYADLVINAIYPEKVKQLNHYYGPDYFCARDEFLLLPQKVISSNVNKVLITFGGVDPNNLTKKSLEAIYSFCIERNIKITVILGLGYQKVDTLSKFEKVVIKENVSNIAVEMLDADICFTSAGRTTYELALVGTPSIVLAQNARELTHFFADEANGFVSLGLGEEVESGEILVAFEGLLKDPNKRRFMHDKMKNNNIREGKSKVVQLIKRHIENEN